MNIQFNLLPDVKLEYLKAERTRRVTVSVSVLVAVVALGLMLLLFSVTQIQKKHISDLSKDIKSDSQKLEGQKDLNKILTVQNQLNSLTALHDQKPAASRLFGYLSQIVPNQANSSSLTIDFTQHTITITGSADSLSTVNKFADTLKFTSYGVDGVQGSKPAFSNVVLTNFGRADKQASYTINFVYDPTIFDIKQNVTLQVPSLITTRSEVDRPADLFVAQPSNTENQ